MVRLAKQIARYAQDMVGKSGANVADLGGLASLLTRDYDRLAQESRGAVFTSSNPEVQTQALPSRFQHNRLPKIC